MRREEYIKSHIVHLLHFWSNTAIGFGSLIILSLSLLDYFVTHSNFTTFLVYRIIAASVILIVFFVNRKIVSTRRHHLATISAAVVVSVMIASMIARFGGHESPYFAGMILAAIFGIGLIPLSFSMSLLVALLIYSIYLIPIIVYDTITNKAFFINANFFILYCIVSLIFLRYMMHQRYVRELSLQFDIEQQKKQLEVYSLQLKGLVEDRTKDLRKSEQWHRSIVDNATDGIIILDESGVVINANDRACQMHGFSREALLGAHIRLLETSNKQEEVADRMRRLMEGESLVYESIHYKKDGSPLYLEISSKAITIENEIFIQSFYRDITEKKKLQEHVFQSQKMDSVGLLAGGIAHDFNNILTAIIGHSDIIRRNVLDEKSVRSLNVIEDAARRAGRMISKLLGFARKSNYEIVPLNLNDVIFDTIKLLERVIDKKIDLTVELDHHLPLMQADLNQMEQVVMNLIINARDAMPEGGRLVIKTRGREVHKGMIDVPPYVTPGEYVQMSVSDTGFGIPKEVLEKIFEPFFTTKERGKGTGLGLSMVYGAVKEHRGYIWVQSTPGSGTNFTIYIPASRTAVRTEVNQELPSVTGCETVLVVDDEHEILHVIQDSLVSHGYKVFAISDPASAVSIFEKISSEISLVITDIVMPGINGKELISRMKQIKPETKILAISGYTKYVAPKEEIGEINGFLQKPFESYYLLSVVRRILDARPEDVLKN